MNLRSLPCKIGFADAEFNSYTREGSQLQVRLQAWNQRIIELTFHNVISLSENYLGEISNVCEVIDETTLLSAAIKKHYESIPAQHPFREYHFLTLDESVALAVVAESVEIQIVE